MAAFNFDIKSSGAISQNFTSRNITNFVDACAYIKKLPYKRNQNKNDLSNVFTDQHGTCSTKHALLKQLATENNIGNIKLIMGVFKMNAINSPQVKNTLEKNGLDYIPEAHNYLMVDGKRIDCTKSNFGPEHFVTDLMREVEIQPDQITSFKVKYHKQLLEKWLKESDIKLSFEELWTIREQCIEDLSKKINSK